MVKVALDAMGGDFAPAETVAGAVGAVADGYDVVLVGDPDAIKPLLDDHGADIPIHPAQDMIGMGDDPAKAIRERPDASIVQAARLVRSGGAQALVSAGSTGAALTAAAVILGRVSGVLRPAIASVLPTPGSMKVLLDAGANPDVRAEHLLQFAAMGSVAAEIYAGIEEPRIGLLNIGEESSKGRDLEREAHDLLGASSLRFVGNVEGRDISTEKADVIVTDGFTGNVMLKASEGTARMVTALVIDAVNQLPSDQQSEALSVLSKVKDDMDYQSYGGAHLLGVKGVVVIAHGSASHVSVTRSIEMAADGAGRGLVERVSERISA